MNKSLQDRHILSSYYAPRGESRMYNLGRQIAHQYLDPKDKLIGIIGDAGSGKSSLIRGMFPGLELTNDDHGVYIRPLPLLEQDVGFSMFAPHTYHVDIRFENGFTQMNELAQAIYHALSRHRRVVVEHFDLVYPFLGFNADLLIGVGEEVLISRPNVFGPAPNDIRDKVYESLPYRLMSHTAEDLCEFCLPKEALEHCEHDDVRHGFVISFQNPPMIDLRELEKKIQDLIDQDLPITYRDETHVNIGPYVHPCTGPRIHVRSTGQVKDFHLIYHFVDDPVHKRHLLVGVLGEENMEKLRNLDTKLTPAIFE